RRHQFRTQGIRKPLSRAAPAQAVRILHEPFPTPLEPCLGPLQFVGSARLLGLVEMGNGVVERWLELRPVVPESWFSRDAVNERIEPAADRGERCALRGGCAAIR